MTDGNDFLSQICKVKHGAIDKEMKSIKEKIEDSKENVEIRHEELKTLISSLDNSIRESHNNLKNKIVLSEKTMGEKIDSLKSFDDTLKGNGKPGVWESIRSIKRNMKIMMGTVIIILVLTLGGSYKGVSLEKIKNFIGIEKTETKEVTKIEEKIKTAIPVMKHKETEKKNERNNIRS